MHRIFKKIAIAKKLKKNRERKASLRETFDSLPREEKNMILASARSAADLFAGDKQSDAMRERVIWNVVREEIAHLRQQKAKQLRKKRKISKYGFTGLRKT